MNEILITVMIITMVQMLMVVVDFWQWQRLQLQPRLLDAHTVVL